MERRNEHGQPIGFALPDWKAPPFPPHATLTGASCRLEPLQAARHARDLWQAQAEDSTSARWTYLFNGPFDDEAAFGTGKAAAAMAAAANGELQPVVAGMGNGCGNVGRAGNADDQSGAPEHVAIGDGARLVVVGVIGCDHSACNVGDGGRRSRSRRGSRGKGHDLSFDLGCVALGCGYMGVTAARFNGARQTPS